MDRSLAELSLAALSLIGVVGVGLVVFRLGTASTIAHLIGEAS